jgi:hypothetical protein
MQSSGLHTIIKDVIDAHGGSALWNSLEALEAEISAWGLLFTIKRQPVLKHIRVRASTREPHFAFLDFPQLGQTSELIGNDEVRIIDSDARVVARRLQPRSAFQGIRRKFYWDKLDFIYFAGYATWNYLTTPFLFLRKGFQFEVLPPLPGVHPTMTRLRVTFPVDIPTHCLTQIFYFDECLYLKRLDYTAEVVGKWARAAHLCLNYRTFDGLKAPTKRRVYPLIAGNNPLPAPTLIALEIHDINLIHIV